MAFPFIYHFNYRIESLVCLSFANDFFRRISTSFHHHFKICVQWLLHKKECSSYKYLFCCTEMRWLFISSSAKWDTGSDAGSVASRTRSKLTRSKCEWTIFWTTYLACSWNDPITSYHSTTYCPNVSTTPITAMGCRQCFPLSVVQLKGKHCRKSHCCNGVVDTFGHYFVFLFQHEEVQFSKPVISMPIICF